MHPSSALTADNLQSRALARVLDARETELSAASLCSLARRTRHPRSACLPTISVPESRWILRGSAGRNPTCLCIYAPALCAGAAAHAKRGPVL